EQPTISRPPTSSPHRMLRSSMKAASISPQVRRGATAAGANGGVSGTMAGTGSGAAGAPPRPSPNSARRPASPFPARVPPPRSPAPGGDPRRRPQQQFLDLAVLLL